MKNTQTPLAYPFNCEWGVTKISDLEKLRDMGLYGAIMGKAIYEGMITLDQLSRFSC